MQTGTTPSGQNQFGEQIAAPLAGTGEPLVDLYFRLQSEFRQSLSAQYTRSADADPQIWHAIGGSIKLLDALYLAEQLRLTRPQRVLEVGSFLGFSTRWILEVSREWEPAVISVDPGLRHRIFDDVRSHVRRFCEDHTPRLGLIDACLSNKNVEMFSHDYLNYEPRLSQEETDQRIAAVPVLTEPFESCDFAFIDGDHEVPATVANTLLIARMMPAGGTIVVHDAITWKQVEPALRLLTDAAPDIVLESVAGRAFHMSASHIWQKPPPPRRLIRRAFRSAASQLSPLLPRSMLAQRPDFIARGLCDGVAVLRVRAPNRIEVIDRSKLMQDADALAARIA